jgi:hypothetical protein
MTRLWILAVLALAAAVGLYAAVEGHGQRTMHHVTTDPPPGTFGPP